jgi:uncharacterized membrane protein YqjE
MSDRPPAAPAGGLLVSLRRLVATLLELAQVRLELIANEIEEQKLRILAGLIWAAFGVLLVGLGLVLLIGCIVLLFWDGYRLQAMAVLTLVFLAGGALALRRASAQLQSKPGAFAASVAELVQDRERLAPAPGVEPPRP